MLSKKYSLKEFIKIIFSQRKDMEIKFLDKMLMMKFRNTANKIVHFGWKKEAIPIIKRKKSIIASIF